MARVLTLTTPFLESGDRLSRAEFHRRYCLNPDIKRAELVEGVVYVASPTRFNVHAQQHAFVMGWLTAYFARHPDLKLGVEATVFLDDNNEVKPDAVLWRDDPGVVGLDEEGYIEGAPQLIVEIAASSASYDLHDKMEAYRRNGVHEFIIWRVLDSMIDWFRLRDGRYEWVEPDQDGVIESDQFPGLHLNLPKLLMGDLAAVLADLDR